MFLITLEAEGEVGYPLKLFNPPVIFYISDRSKAVLLILLVLVSVAVLILPSVCLDDDI